MIMALHMQYSSVQNHVSYRVPVKIVPLHRPLLPRLVIPVSLI